MRGGVQLSPPSGPQRVQARGYGTYEDSRDLLLLWIYSILVDPIEGETNPNPKANFQKISECQRHNAQMLFSAIRFYRDQGPSDGRPEHQPTSEAPTPSGLTTRIRDGKPDSPY